MAASDKAFIDARNASEANRLSQEAAVRQEERLKAADKRQVVLEGQRDILFKRSTTLFEQQQKFMADEEAQRKLGKEMNTGLALFKASGGQIIQPMLSAYDKIPDGGKFHKFIRNAEDNTYDFDIEWQGQRYRKEGATFEEVGKIFMAGANPNLYLEQSGAIAAAQAEFLQKRQLAIINALKNNKDEARNLLGNRMTVKEFADLSDVFLREYNNLRDNSPEQLQIPDASAEGGLREQGFEEFKAERFFNMGFDLSGAKLSGDGKKVESLDLPEVTDTFAQTSTKFRALGVPAESLNTATINQFLQDGRFDELESKQQDLFSPEERELIKRGIIQGRDKKSGEDSVEGEEQAAINVGDSRKAPNDKKNKDIFADPQRKIPIEKIVDGLAKATGALAAGGEKIRRNRLAAIWRDVLKGKAGATRLEALAVLSTGRQEAKRQYLKIRLELPSALRSRADKEFGVDRDLARVAETSDIQREFERGRNILESLDGGTG